jgi:hypothetical protein
MLAVHESQKYNTKRAYSTADVGTDYLDKILKKSVNAKSELVTKLKLTCDGSTKVNKPLTADEYLDNHTLNHLTSKYNDWSFNFTSCQVTFRKTGKCFSLKQWLKDHFFSVNDTNNILSLTKQSHTLIISANPWFILGQSCRYNGRQLDSSCHWPASEYNYSSGSVSHALDKHTIAFIKWSETTKEITGRQLVYMDLDNGGFITSRCYGNFTEGDSTILRKHIYKTLNVPEYKKTKDFTINTNDYRGYTDTSYLQGYRDGNRNKLVIDLEEAICPTCGSHHTDGKITCEDCTDSKYICDNCGDGVHEDDMYCTDYGDTYCSDCYHELFAYCECCDSTIDREEIIECHDGRNTYYYCEDCAQKKNFYKCEDCGTWHSIDYLTTCDDYLYCENCLPAGDFCEDCGEYHRDNDNVTRDGKIYCDPGEDEDTHGILTDNL